MVTVCGMAVLCSIADRMHDAMADGWKAFHAVDIITYWPRVITTCTVR